MKHRKWIVLIRLKKKILVCRSFSRHQNLSSESKLIFKFIQDDLVRLSNSTYNIVLKLCNSSAFHIYNKKIIYKTIALEILECAEFFRITFHSLRFKVEPRLGKQDNKTK